MAVKDAFVPDAEFVGKNMFYLVLVISFFILIGFMVKSLINNKARNYGPLKTGYTTKLVSDVIRHNPVKNIHLECPRDPHKYSFTFFLNIDDFYCNRGYWKCVMIKGSPVSEKGTECKESITKIFSDIHQEFIIMIYSKNSSKYKIIANAWNIIKKNL